MNQDELKRLQEEATKSMENAYAPINEFSVGAAVLTENGNIYGGCNTESIVDIGTCAERNAINNAVSNGEYCFKAILITSQQEEPLRPCGSCLQYIFEFSQVADHEIEVIMHGNSGETERQSVSDMLPEGVGPKNLELDIEKYRERNG